MSEQPVAFTTLLSRTISVNSNGLGALPMSPVFKGEIRVLPDDHAPAHLKPLGTYRQHWAVDSSRIRQELGYEEPVSLAEALRGTIKWDRANPPAASVWKFDYDAEDAALAATALS
jgi:hypothetical protein